MVADKVVEAFRDVNAEGDIRGSSDRYLRQAAQAAIGASRAGVVEGPPTLWHMYRMLLPAETDVPRAVVDALMPNPRYVDTATFFGRELPGDLRDASCADVGQARRPAQQAAAADGRVARQGAPSSATADRSTTSCAAGRC